MCTIKISLRATVTFVRTWSSYFVYGLMVSPLLSTVSFTSSTKLSLTFSLLSHAHHQITMDQPQRPGQAAQSAPQQGPVATQSTPGAAMLPPHMMNLMADPAIAAAASSIFPPAAMLNNPGAFFAMPQLFSPTGMPAPNSLSAAESGVATQMRANQAMPTGFNTNTSQNTGAAAAWAQPMIATSGGAMVPMQMGNAAGRTHAWSSSVVCAAGTTGGGSRCCGTFKVGRPGDKRSQT